MEAYLNALLLFSNRECISIDTFWWKSYIRPGLAGYPSPLIGTNENSYTGRTSFWKRINVFRSYARDGATCERVNRTIIWDCCIFLEYDYRKILIEMTSLLEEDIESAFDVVMDDAEEPRLCQGGILD